MLIGFKVRSLGFRRSDFDKLASALLSVKTVERAECSAYCLLLTAYCLHSRIHGNCRLREFLAGDGGDLP
jgi:hypothetical protein